MGAYSAGGCVGGAGICFEPEGLDGGVSVCVCVFILFFSFSFFPSMKTVILFSTTVIYVFQTSCPNDGLEREARDDTAL